LNPEALKLLRTRAFQIAAIWEVFCVGGGLVAFYSTGVEAFAVVGIIAGIVPMSLVMLRFIRAQKTGQAAARSRDIVQ